MMSDPAIGLLIFMVIAFFVIAVMIVIGYLDGDQDIEDLVAAISKKLSGKEFQSEKREKISVINREGIEHDKLPARYRVRKGFNAGHEVYWLSCSDVRMAIWIRVDHPNGPFYIKNYLKAHAWRHAMKLELEAARAILEQELMTELNGATQ